ncbi:MAG: hypothetical protein I4N51_15185 [Acinetobacter sp.]|nr:hypothetical protein [Acinetobacter sp.]
MDDSNFPFYFSYQQNGITVYLEMTPPQLVSRLHNREKRPLLKGMDDEQLLTFIIGKLEERNVFYHQAKLMINAFDLDPKELLEEIEAIG